MRLLQRIKNRNTYIAVLVIVLGNLLLLPAMKGLFEKIISAPWLVEFLGLFTITLVLFIAMLEVFEL
jgi:hypothetical protein